jgi:hypothetical protein
MWILVDMHDQPPWVNKFLFPPAIKNKWTESLMTDRLATLTKRVAELRQASLEACHCIEEFECPRMTDPYREPSEGCLFVFFPHY